MRVCERVREVVVKSEEVREVRDEICEKSVGELRVDSFVCECVKSSALVSD